MNNSKIKTILTKSATFLVGFLMASLLIDFTYSYFKSGDFSKAFTYWIDELSQPRKITTWIIISLVFSSYNVLSDKKK